MDTHVHVYQYKNISILGLMLTVKKKDGNIHAFLRAAYISLAGDREGGVYSTAAFIREQHLIE